MELGEGGQESAYLKKKNRVRVSVVFKPQTRSMVEVQQYLARFPREQVFGRQSFLSLELSASLLEADNPVDSVSL